MAETKEITDLELNAFLTTYGAAMLLWGTVEMTLFKIFAVLIHARTDLEASAAYHAVINFNTRLQMIDEVAKIALVQQPALLEDWECISRKCNKRSGNRNALAHFIAASDIKKDGKEFMILKPSGYDVRSAKEIAYDIKQVLEFRDSFKALADELNEFCRDIRAVLRPA